ncbi:MAG TPA: N,N-dimethylformamidase beta subunit family domain-containing protein [Solirubrobacteraceae bacterium]|nr:N,N-dimethylformamidase beta subunit family domain-containing protein [Solirubrobacteraceae bacterium]
MLVLCLLAFPRISSAANSISSENALPGDSSWYRLLAPESSLDIYASESSLLPGEMLQLHVSAAAGTRYRVMVYRLGWYQGSGARSIGCVSSCASEREGNKYPVPAPESSSGFLDAGWPVTDSFQIPATAVSGYYLAEAVATTGPSSGRMRYYPFVVRAPAGLAPSRILVQIGLNTSEAYNQWGGKSLYAFNSTGEVPAVKVSLNRPYQEEGSGSQAMDPYQLIRFIERAGYDVSYASDMDTDAEPEGLLKHKLVIVAGHDEYWTKGAYNAFEAARNAGVDLAIFGADAADWQSRYEDADRTIVEYRSATADPETDPTLKTVEFRKLAAPRFQCELFGVEYRGGFVKYVPNHEPQAYTATPAVATNAWFAGSGISPGAVFPGLVGYEWDTIMPGCNVPPVMDLFHWEGVANADSTVYTASSGARVFASGSLDFARGLDEWPYHGTGVESGGLQRFAVTMLSDLSESPPATPQQLTLLPPSPPVSPPSPAPRQITSLRVSPSAFRAARSGAALARRRASVGARVTYVDSGAGATTVSLYRYAHVRCRSRRHHHGACLLAHLLARFIRQDIAGADGFKLTGRLGGRALSPGGYLLSLVPRSAGTSAGRSARFRIVR